MTDVKVGGHALVTMQVEIMAHSNWGTDCSLEQLYKQGAEDAEGVMRRLQLDRQSGIRNYKILRVDAVIRPKEK